MPACFPEQLLYILDFLSLLECNLDLLSLSKGKWNPQSKSDSVKFILFKMDKTAFIWRCSPWWDAHVTAISLSLRLYFLWVSLAIEAAHWNGLRVDLRQYLLSISPLSKIFL